MSNDTVTRRTASIAKFVNSRRYAEGFRQVAAGMPPEECPTYYCDSRYVMGRLVACWLKSKGRDIQDYRFKNGRRVRMDAQWDFHYAYQDGVFPPEFKQE